MPGHGGLSALRYVSLPAPSMTVWKPLVIPIHGGLTSEFALIRNVW
ncbi:MAG: hypothetical protein WB873_03415 [Thermoplasmata archaeon]